MGTKTDNKYFVDKVMLRLKMLPEMDSINVLDVFGGHGRTWAAIKRLSSRKINVVGMDVKSDLDLIYLVGDNRKYLQEMDLKKYDVIDLDAYGCPVEYLDIIFERGYMGLVFVTFIQSVHGRLPIVMLEQLGYSRQMVEKCRSLFNRNGKKKLLNYLGLKGVSKVMIKSKARHNYLGFYTGPAVANSA